MYILLCIVYWLDVLLLLVVARPMTLTAVPGLPVFLPCSQKPAAPVSWSFWHLPDSEAQHIITEGSVVSDYTNRFGIRGSHLIIYKVRPSDAGSYDCFDAAGEVFTYNVTVDGEEIAVF